MKAKLLALGLLAALLVSVGVSVSAPALSTRVEAAHAVAPSAAPSHTIVGKGRILFAFHAGLAFYAFHHYVWNRFKRHQFDPGAHFRKLHLVEAAIALVFTYHELKVALKDANGSNSPVLHKLVAPLNALVAKFTHTADQFNSGNFNSKDLTDLNNSTAAFSNQASHAGYQIAEVPVTVPGA